jgi:hypothetical protein
LDKLDLSTKFNTRTYLWGKCLKGVSMERDEKVYTTPKVFEKIHKYDFSTINIQQDFALGVGHGVSLKFELKNESEHEIQSDQKEV